MIKHNCKEHLVFDGVIDQLLPFGDIESMAIFKCEICGKEFREDERDDINN